MPPNKDEEHMTPVDGSRDTISFIQMLRGFAPIPVVLAHVPGLWLQENRANWTPFDLYRQMVLHPLQLDNTGGRFGVILFFLISGFIISMVAEKETRSEFFIKRVFRIFPPLFAATLIGFVTVRLSQAYGWGPIHSNNAVETIDFIKSAFMLSWVVETPRAISVAWSLMPELIFYGFVMIVIGLLKKSPVRATLILMALYGSLTLPMAAFGYLSYLGYFTVYLPLFLIGRVFYLHYARQVSGEGLIALFLLNLILFVSIFNSRFPGELFRSEYAGFFNIALACALFHGLMTWRPAHCPRVLTFFSKISYSFYLIHLSVGICVLNALSTTDVAFGLKVALALALSIAISFLNFLLVEQPSQKLARHLVRLTR